MRGAIKLREIDYNVMIQHYFCSNRLCTINDVVCKTIKVSCKKTRFKIIWKYIYL